MGRPIGQFGEDGPQPFSTFLGRSLRELWHGGQPDGADAPVGFGGPPGLCTPRAARPPRPQRMRTLAPAVINAIGHDTVPNRASWATETAEKKPRLRRASGQDGMLAGIDQPFDYATSARRWQAHAACLMRPKESPAPGQVGRGLVSLRGWPWAQPALRLRPRRRDADKTADQRSLNRRAH
jgi:hypothetical protein